MWDAIFREGKETGRVEPFIEHFYEKYKTELGNSRLLDLGSGTGRHSIYFAKKGLEVYAMDKSKTALDILRERVSKEVSKEFSIKLVESTLDEILFPDEFFGSIVSTLVLHHGTSEQIKKWLKEIKRALKPEGLLAMSVLSRNDKRHNTGIEIEPNTRLYIADTFDSEAPHHFFAEEEIIQALADFSILELNETERYSAAGYGKFRHWDAIGRLKSSY